MIKKKLSTIGEDKLSVKEIDSMLVLISDKKDGKVNYRGKYTPAVVTPSFNLCKTLLSELRLRLKTCHILVG